MAVRGGKVHGTILMWDLPEVVPNENEESRGRSEELVRLRNEHILYRYLWYAKDRRNAYAWILEQLQTEFYLSVSTLGQLIEKSGDELYNMKATPLTEKQIRDKYPFFKW